MGSLAYQEKYSVVRLCSVLKQEMPTYVSNNHSNNVSIKAGYAIQTQLKHAVGDMLVIIRQWPYAVIELLPGARLYLRDHHTASAG